MKTCPSTLILAVLAITAVLSTAEASTRRPTFGVRRNTKIQQPAFVNVEQSSASMTADDALLVQDALLESSSSTQSPPRVIAESARAAAIACISAAAISGARCAIEVIGL